MRLISKFHDYYDAAQAQGIDLTRVYVRTRVEVEQASRNETEVPAEARRFVKFAKERCPRGKQYSLTKGARMLEHVEFGLILFAGALHPFARVDIRNRTTYQYEVETHHSFETLATALAEFDVDLRKSDRDCIGLMHLWGRQIEPFFELKGSEEFLNAAVEDCLCIAAYQARYDKLEVNPRLADYQLFKTLNAWQAYQELDMFVGNLAAPDRLPVQVADKDRIYQHGFDKMSFRKAPQA